MTFGTSERSRAVFALDVDGDAEVDVLAVDARGRGVLLDKRRVHARELLDGVDDRPRDDVRERRFRLAGQREVVVDDAPVLFEALTGMLRMEVAVGIDSEASMFWAIFPAAPRSGTVVFGSMTGHRARDGDRGSGDGVGLRCAGWSWAASDSSSKRLKIVEELLPARTHRIGIGLILLVELFDEGDVGAVTRCRR